MDTLPKEIISFIIFYCTFKDTITYMTVSKTFNEICNNNMLWLQFIKRDNYKTFTGNYVMNYKSNYILEKFSKIYKIDDLFAARNISLGNIILKIIPKEFGQLTKLQELDLSNNQLTTIPKELGQLTNLQRFYLKNNQLTIIPQEITNLKQFGCNIYSQKLK